MRFSCCHFYTLYIFIQNEKWPNIPGHPDRIIIIGGSGSGKTNALINLINEQNDLRNKRFEETKIWKFD